MKKGRSLIAYLLWALLIVAGGGFLVKSLFLEKKPEKTIAATPSTANFVKEGEVGFWRKGREYKKIDVEIAENEAERNKGLMFRPFLPDSVGMLFIFEQPGEHSFWMKNTAIPLDIVYVGPDKKIISIAENTRPYSEESIPPYGLVKYVVEFNAGFTKSNNIQSGDAISF
ncbi:DUF192 domain-containing protein [Dyadobacter sp. CY261]|uniref:DUF192 domain-containing protein n=1 Tax=Dyadobacter sp. CY261 TaxID=2907203 RepID=UPI001F21DCDF|nr:DUF192 domain-containing protein [Dyadobacter sp. CY261]MCF0072595.1 DUF192 domain-containing protein [Dyadobacter sp. CY261]